MKPQKLTVVGGKRKQVDFDSRSEEYKNYNKTRWNYDKKLTRFYNSSIWRSTSKLVLLRDDYVCQMCGGEATMVDHIIPIKKDWSRRLILTIFKQVVKHVTMLKLIVRIMVKIAQKGEPSYLSWA